MKVCIPVTEDWGLQSPVCGHFGSAPAFLLVDTESNAHRVLVNSNAHHEHGHCTPLALFGGERIDAFVVGGIGAGALSKLLASGALVYRGRLGPAAAVLADLASEALPALDLADSCGHHHG